MAWQLHRLFKGHINVMLINVITACDIRQKQPIKQPLLQGFCQACPIAKLIESIRFIPWVRPQTMIDMPSAIHIKGVENNRLWRVIFFFYRLTHHNVPRRGGNTPLSA